MELLKSLDWDVALKAITCEGIAIPDYQALKRTDNGTILNLVKSSYNPTTNEELTNLATQLSEISGYAIEGYAEFSAGKKVLAYLRSNTVTIANFEVENFLVIGNSHDGTQTTYIGLTTIIKPENNAFSRILKQVKIPHTVNSGIYLKNLTQGFEYFNQLQTNLHQKWEQWSNIQLSLSERQKLTKKVVGINPLTADENISTRKRNIYLHIEEIVEQQMKVYGNNLLGWFNGVTHYTTHVRPSKEKVFGNIIGATAYFNEIAFEVANKHSVELL